MVTIKVYEGPRFEFCYVHIFFKFYYDVTGDILTYYVTLVYHSEVAISTLVEKYPPLSKNNNNGSAHRLYPLEIK